MPKNPLSPLIKRLGDLKPRRIEVKPAPPAPEHVQQTEDKLWEVLGGREFQSDAVARQQLSQQVAGQAKKVRDQAVKQNLITGEEDPTYRGVISEVPVDTNAFREFIGLAGSVMDPSIFPELGLSSIPYLHSVIAAGKAVAQGALAAMTERKRRKARTLAEHFKQNHAEYASLGGAGVEALLRDKRDMHCVKIGAYTCETAVGLFDPTPLSGLAVSGGLLALKLRIVYETYKAIKERVNPALRDRSRFNLELFRSFPLLACYVFHENIETSTLLGFAKAYELESLSAGEKSQALSKIHGHLSQRKPEEIQKEYTENLKPLEALALSRKAAASFLLLTKNQKIPSYLTTAKRRLGKYT